MPQFVLGRLWVSIGQSQEMKSTKEVNHVYAIRLLEAVKRCGFAVFMVNKIYKEIDT
jgi:hypothetical protein